MLVRVVVQNAGQYRSEPLSVRVRRMVNGRTSGVFNRLWPCSVAYQDTLVFVLPNERDADGLNQFAVEINPVDSYGTPTVADGNNPNLIRAERNHGNNAAVAEVTIANQQPVLIYPAPGSIVPTTAVRLTASYQADNPRPFDLELDSTARFDSPFRLCQRIASANLISYRTNLPARPGVTYYWRVRLADVGSGTGAGDSAGWSVGSFVYAPGSTATGLPEGQILLAGKLPTDIQQGDVVQVPVVFTNLSPYPFTDSLVVRQTVYAAGLTEPRTMTWRVPAPAPGDTLRFTARIATETLPGVNRVLLTVNPRLLPESTFLNNTLDLPLPVQPDRLGPVLEVAFDGRRIDDGAVVSARPLIDVLVADDNRSLIPARHDGPGFVTATPRRNQSRRTAQLARGHRPAHCNRQRVSGAVRRRPR